MPTATRAAASLAKRSASSATSSAAQQPLAFPAAKKRRVATKKPAGEAAKAASGGGTPSTNAAADGVVLIPSSANTATTTIPAPPASTHVARIPLSFSLEAAQKYLVDVDARFGPIFARAGPCKPFVDATPGELEKPVDVFRSLTVSILGQQISWLAARSITHRFIRLWFADELPEKHELNPEEAAKYAHHFPTPTQVLSVDIVTLRSAGLSQRKAEYIQGLADKFVSGELSAEHLIKADDDEVLKKLTGVRGIGKWTVEMFSMFTLRRPDVLSAADLGLQKGLLRFTLLPFPSSTAPPLPSTSDDPILLPTDPLPPHPSASEVAAVAQDVQTGDPLLSVSVLRSRLSGKKVKGGAYLTPDEMARLTDSWRPYRSVGAYYLWDVADGTADAASEVATPAVATPTV